jgi:hypothetical protein
VENGGSASDGLWIRLNGDSVSEGLWISIVEMRQGIRRFVDMQN